jgi:hypothetical protein
MIQIEVDRYPMPSRHRKNNGHNVVLDHKGVQLVDVTRKSMLCDRNGVTTHGQSLFPYSGVVLGPVILFHRV